MAGGPSPSADGSRTVASLLATRKLSQGHRLQPDLRGHSTGFPTLDEVLPAGGYPRGGITELIGTGPRHSLALPGFAAASHTGQVAYLSRDVLLHPQVLAANQVALDNCHFLLEDSQLRLFWAAQQLLASGHFPFLLIYGSNWRDHRPLLDPLAYRRLRGLTYRHDAVVLLILDEHPALETFARPCALRLAVTGTSAHPLRQRERQVNLCVRRHAGSSPGAVIQVEVR